MKFTIRPVPNGYVVDEKDEMMYYKIDFEPIIMSREDFMILFGSLNAENLVVLDVGNKTTS